MTTKQAQILGEVVLVGCRMKAWEVGQDIQESRGACKE